MKKLWNWVYTIFDLIITSKVRLSMVILAVGLGIGIIWSNYILDNSADPISTFQQLGDGTFVEYMGLLFDIVLLLLLFNILDVIGDRQREIKRYKEELDDYRNWDAPEAKHRVDGILRRLEKLVDWRTIDIKDLHLGGCELKYVVKAVEEKIPFCSLEGFKFDKQYLEENNLNVGFLKSADLVEANLQSADLGFANLQSADLLRANLESAKLAYANLESAHLGFANLELAKLSKANLESADLFGANLESADLTGANLESANLIGANLESAKLREANLESADLVSANLESAGLLSANLESAFLPSAHLESAKLSEANLESAYLASANLESADLMYANLESADLRVANLQSANLFGAHLQSADLREATVDQKYWIENLATKHVVKGAKEIAQKYVVDLSSEVKFCDVETKEERSYFEIKKREKTKQFSTFENRLTPSQKRGKLMRSKKIKVATRQKKTISQK